MENDGLTDARLRELYQRALAARGGRERERCVAPEAILAGSCFTNFPVIVRNISS